MLNLGIIGTNWITDQFIQAALETKRYTLHSVFSRSAEKGKQFASKYEGEIKNFENLEEFLSDSVLDVVYIASPNGVHFSQAKAALEHNVHAIVEKPAFSTVEEMEEILSLASSTNAFYFEAIRSLHEESFGQIKEIVDQKEVWGADLNFAKYSSRMQQLLDGEEPNIFSAKFSGGALMDLGVYLVYPTVAWFGIPESVHYLAKMLPTGVDAYGTGVLRYENFDVTIRPGKNIDRYTSSEIYFSDGTLSMNEISMISELTLSTRGEETKKISVNQKKNPMSDEAKVFADIIENNDVNKYEELAALSQKVNQVMVDLRRSAGIVFAADKKEKHEN